MTTEVKLKNKSNVANKCQNDEDKFSLESEKVTKPEEIITNTKSNKTNVYYSHISSNNDRHDTQKFIPGSKNHIADTSNYEKTSFTNLSTEICRGIIEKVGLMDKSGSVIIDKNNESLVSHRDGTDINEKAKKLNRFDNLLEIMEKSEKNQEDLEFIYSSVKDMEFFKKFEDDFQGGSDNSDDFKYYLYPLFKKMTIERHPKNTLILKENEPSNHKAYIILDGKVGIWKHNIFKIFEGDLKKLNQAGTIEKNIIPIKQRKTRPPLKKIIEDRIISKIKCMIVQNKLSNQLGPTKEEILANRFKTADGNNYWEEKKDDVGDYVDNLPSKIVSQGNSPLKRQATKTHSSENNSPAKRRLAKRYSTFVELGKVINISQTGKVTPKRQIGSPLKHNCSLLSKIHEGKSFHSEVFDKMGRKNIASRINTPKKAPSLLELNVVNSDSNENIDGVINEDGDSQSIVKGQFKQLEKITVHTPKKRPDPIKIEKQRKSSQTGSPNSSISCTEQNDAKVQNNSNIGSPRYFKPKPEKAKKVEKIDDNQIAEAMKVTYGEFRVEMGEGLMFGHLALTENKPRAATVQTTTDVVFIVIHKIHFDLIEKMYHKEKQLKKEFMVLVMPNLANVTAEKYIIDMINSLVAETHHKRHILTRQNEVSFKIYFIKSGTVKVSYRLNNKTVVDLCEVAENSLIGEESLFCDRGLYRYTTEVISKDAKFFVQNKKYFETKMPFDALKDLSIVNQNKERQRMNIVEKFMELIGNSKEDKHEHIYLKKHFVNKKPILIKKEFKKSTNEKIPNINQNPELKKKLEISYKRMDITLDKKIKHFFNTKQKKFQSTNKSTKIKSINYVQNNEQSNKKLDTEEIHVENLENSITQNTIKLNIKPSYDNRLDTDFFNPDLLNKNLNKLHRDNERQEIRYERNNLWEFNMQPKYVFGDVENSKKVMVPEDSQDSKTKNSNRNSQIRKQYEPELSSVLLNRAKNIKEITVNYSNNNDLESKTDISGQLIGSILNLTSTHKSKTNQSKTTKVPIQRLSRNNHIIDLEDSNTIINTEQKSESMILPSSSRHIKNQTAADSCDLKKYKYPPCPIKTLKRMQTTGDLNLLVGPKDIKNKLESYVSGGNYVSHNTNVNSSNLSQLRHPQSYANFQTVKSQYDNFNNTHDIKNLIQNSNRNHTNVFRELRNITDRSPLKNNINMKKSGSEINFTAQKFRYKTETSCTRNYGDKINNLKNQSTEKYLQDKKNNFQKTYFESPIIQTRKNSNQKLKINYYYKKLDKIVIDDHLDISFN